MLKILEVNLKCLKIASNQYVNACMKNSPVTDPLLKCVYECCKPLLTHCPEIPINLVKLKLYLLNET